MIRPKLRVPFTQKRFAVKFMDSIFSVPRRIKFDESESTHQSDILDAEAFEMLLDVSLLEPRGKSAKIDFGCHGNIKV